MTYIEKRKSPSTLKPPSSFEPIKLSFRDRKYGSEFNQWELKLLREFAYAKASSNPTVSGSVVYDRTLGSRRFLLIPAAHLSQDYVICECPEGISMPANLSYLRVQGKKAVFYDYWEIMVDKIDYEKINLPIKPDIDFNEFKDLLFLHWGGLFSPLKEILAFEFVSSPPLLDLGQAGGLSVTLYDGSGRDDDGASRNESRKLLNYFRSILPPDIALGKSGNLSLPELATDQPLSPFSWHFSCFNADKPLNQHLIQFLDHKRSKRFSEISVGLGSKRNGPMSIYDPPLTKVDQPILLPDSAEMLKMSFDPPLEVTKYIITMQMMFPSVGKNQVDFSDILQKASQRIVDFAEKYDMPQAVKRHGLFDPNYYGKPQSILRLGLATARSHEKQLVDTEWIMQAFDMYYMKNMESVIEAWPEVMTSKGVELVSLREFDRQVLKYITEKETRELGVGFSILSERFPNEIELRVSLQRLLDYKTGKIYEVKHDVFRSVPFAR